MNASGILAAVKTTLTTKFRMTKEMIEAHTSEIVEVTVWVEKTQFKIYGVYSPPNNKNLNLDILNTMNDTIIVGDINTASITWGYGYQNHPGKTNEEYLNSNSLTLLYDPGESKTLIHYSGSTTNPDLLIDDNCKWIIIGDPGSGHRMTKTSLKLKTSNPTPSKQVMWNFKKANWSEFSMKVDNQLGDTYDNDSPYILSIKLCDAIKKNI